MSKYLYFQDAHFSGKNPISYIGNCFEDTLYQFDELLSIAKENKVDAILDGGDLFHSPVVSYSISDTIIDKVEKANLQYKVLFGNHSTYFHDIEHQYNTTLNHILRRSKNFEYLTHFGSFGNKAFEIKPVEYSHNIEDELKNNGIICDLQSNKDNKDVWRIAIVHAFVTPKSFRDDVLHVVCDDIKTNADLVLVAHYHSPWQKKVGNTQYTDIGCFGRRSITEYNIQPSCILLDTDKRSYEVILLKSAKSGTEIFDLSKKEQIKEFEGKITAFIDDLKDISVQSLDLKGIIVDLGKKNNVDKDIVDILINKLEKLEKIL
jgi:DNA repair exonuclease SbcCD nuclease subunit